MRHLNKTNNPKALYRGNMSIAVVGHARAGIVVGEHPEDSTIRVMAAEKMNNAPKKPTPLGYRLENHPTLNVARVVWCGEFPKLTADDLVVFTSKQEKEANQQKQTTLEACCLLLQHIITQGGGKVRAKDIKAELAAAGFSHYMIEKAANKLTILDHEMEQADDGKKHRVYYWTLK